MRENAISMRIGRVIVCGCLLTMSVLSGRTALGGSDTTFYVVRHAETEAPTNDPPLTEQGMRRAEELREVLGDVPLSAVYATRTLRTFQTAMPTAAAARLEITTYDATRLRGPGFGVRPI
jgi:broad specificity phosphatase PhoE